ncbi:hypothetical protein [Crateriforma conspicua]|uniref:hypothetical protein n=1 Tax=Crateriforma conspicua TaxID=2527996 RepID=UPI0011A09262|nr:hypothetical protein [Crateriforma conspicua]
MADRLRRGAVSVGEKGVMMPETICQTCGNVIEFSRAKHNTVVECSQCGDPVRLWDRSIRVQIAQARANHQRPISNNTAAILSLFCPGLGQMCLGAIPQGIGLLFASMLLGAMTIIFLPFGFLLVTLHVAQVVDAARM